MKTERKQRGRPASAIDLEQLEKLAGLACTIEEAAAFLRVSKRTLLRRLEQNPKIKRVWDEGLLKANISLRRRQFALAMSDSASAVTMLLHLSKHRLGQNDKSIVEMTGKNGGPIQLLDLADMSREELATRAAALGLPTKIFED